MPLADFPITIVPDVLTSDEVRLFDWFRPSSSRPSASLPTKDMVQDRLIFEIARREPTLGLVIPLIGPDVVYWWGEFLASGVGHDDHFQLVEDGLAVTLIVAAATKATPVISVRVVGGGSRQFSLPPGAALVLPSQFQWSLEPNMMGDSRVLVLSFAAPTVTLRAQTDPQSTLRGLEVAGNCRSGSIPLAPIPYRGPRSAFALPTTALSFEAPNSGSPVQVLLDGHTDVLNSLRVWTSGSEDRGDLSPFAESLLIPLRADSRPTYRAAPADGVGDPVEPHLGLAWTAAPLHATKPLSSGPLPENGTPISTTYLKSLAVEQFAFDADGVRAMGLYAADRVVVLQSGQLEFGNEVMGAPALLLIPAGAPAELRPLGGPAAGLIISLTGLVTELVPVPAVADGATGPVVFCIPLIGRRFARDWDRACQLLDATVRSIYGQTDGRWRIVVVGTDPPTLTAPIDERFEFIAVTRDQADGSLNGQLRDAGYKRGLAEHYARARGAAHIFFCDSDDLLNCELVGAIHSANHPYGCILGRGYILDLGEQKLAPLPLSYDILSLDEQCASCAAFNAAAIPNIINSEINRDGHVRYRERMYRSGRPMLDLPFRAATYVRFAATNMSDLRQSAGAIKVTPDQRLRAAIERQALPITSEIADQFALSALLGERPTAVTFGPKRLSVAVCTHRRPDGLAQLLESLIPQIIDHPDRELIVVNDGTHDERYADVLAPFLSLVRYEALPRSLGIAAARNRSAELARGDYLVFTDDDCEVPAHWLDWLDATLIAQPELDVVAGTTLPLRRSKTELVGEVQDSFGLLPTPHSLGGLDQCFVTACLAIRRQSFQAAGGFSQDPLLAVAGEDTDLSLRLIRAGVRTRIDLDWHVFHALATSIKSEMRRYRRYGWANVHLGQRRGGPAAYSHLPSLGWRALPRKFLDHFAEARARDADISGGPLRRFAACLVAAAVRTSYDWGAVRGAKGLRR